MYSKFKYVTLPLRDIALDDRNPRIVTQTRLTSQSAILKYLFDHENLLGFIRKIVAERRNDGAERPYVIKSGAKYTVIEGNTRIAAYKVLTGLMAAPQPYSASIPKISQTFSDSLLTVDCSVAPSRNALMSIVANSHFGEGDKSKWGYLGSRKALHDEWVEGKTIDQIAETFKLKKGEVENLIIEYTLYLEALKLSWSRADRDRLLSPGVKFNPPVRFLQTRGHKEKIGITYDKARLKVVFTNAEAKRKYKHLIKKLVINPQRGLGATAKYDKVFEDYSSSGARATSATGATSTSAATSSASSASISHVQLKRGALFDYPATVNNNLLRQLMREAKDINCGSLPAAGTFLLRNIVESILKHIIHAQNANPQGRSLDLEGAINVCLSNKVTLSVDDKRVLKELGKTHLSYLNLGSHGAIIPNSDRLMAARDCVDQFVKRNV